FMVPSRFVVLDRFPLTSTGKIDRQRLKQEQGKWPENQDITPPSTATEEELGKIWGEVFEVQVIDRNGDFFELGGDSLSAAIVAARVQAALGVELDLGAFANHPTLAALSAIIDTHHCVAKPSDLMPVSRAEPLVLSSFQERAWKVSRSSE